VRRADRQRWARARTVSDLCELTALWLEGEIGETPTWRGRPDEETGGIAVTLAALNRAGFLTGTSQPGEWGPEGGYQQRAAVQGFTTEEAADVLDLMTAEQGLILTAHRAPEKRTRYGATIPVTMARGRCVYEVGAEISCRKLRLDYWMCPEAADAVCKAVQVTIADPKWGREPVLWALLDVFAATWEAAA
jgi:hypothetical protein